MTKTAIKKGFRAIKSNLEVTDAITVVLCFFSVFAKFNDMPLCFLPLIFIQLAKGSTVKFACLFISITAFSLMSIKTAFYIPYIAFLAMYFVAAAAPILKKSSVKAVYPSVLVFVMCKAYVLTFNYDSVYWAVFAVECVGLVLLAEIVEDGLDIIRFSKSCKEPEELFCVTCAFLFLSLSLTGINLWGVNIAVAVLLCLALSYAQKSNATLSLLSVICIVFCLSQSKHFAFLFAGFLSIYLVGVYLSKNNVYSYLAVCFFAFGVSLLFLVKFNSFTFLTTTALSLIGCFFIDRLKLIKTTDVQVSENLTGEKDYNSLMSKLEKLNRSFRFLGNTVIDISNILTKDGIPEELEGMVSREICKSCKSCTYCWQEKFGDTQGQFSKYAQGLQRGGEPRFDQWFLSSCERIDKLQESFEKSNRLLLAKQLITAAGKQSQKMLQNQFLTISETLQEITHESRKVGIVNTAFTHTISNFLSSMGKKINYCLCYQNNNKLVISSKESISENDCTRIKMKLESLYSSKFSLPRAEEDGASYIYIFIEVPMFSFDFHSQSKGHKSVCGDSCETLQTDEYLYLLLSDGMGTGSFAAAESKTAISMIKSLLGASVKPKTAIDIINIALNLKGTGQSCVSLDVLQVNLYNGECELTKAGAAASLVMHSNEVHTLYKDSLPIGILKDTSVAQSNFILNNGDTVLLLSDGVDIKSNYMQRLRLIGSQYSSVDISQYIVSNCATNDDVTVAALKLVRV